MKTSTIQVRVLAVAGRRAWMAVSGTLGTATLKVLHSHLNSRVSEERTQFFLDVNAVRCDGSLPAGEPSQLLPDGRRLHFHFVGVHERFRTRLSEDRRCTFHSDVASAWDTWSHQP